MIRKGLMMMKANSQNVPSTTAPWTVGRGRMETRWARDGVCGVAGASAIFGNIAPHRKGCSPASLSAARVVAVPIGPVGQKRRSEITREKLWYVNIHLCAQYSPIKTFSFKQKHALYLYNIKKNGIVLWKLDNGSTDCDVFLCVCQWVGWFNIYKWTTYAEPPGQSRSTQLV